MATMTEKCPNCGGELTFNPELQQSSCPYCLSNFSIEELDALTAEAASAADQAGQETEASGASSAAGSGQPDHLVSYVCNSCGAEVVTEETTSATFCYYCHQPVLLSHRLSGPFKPDKVIPFQHSKEAAIEQFRKWARSHKFVPASFYSASQLDKITGIYIPYWMADYTADVDYAGQAAVRRSWISGAFEYTEVKDYLIERRGAIEVDHIHEVAIQKIDRELIDSITPFDETAVKDFNPSYLSGFFAERYDIDADALKPNLETRARSYVTSLIQDSIQGVGAVQEQRNSVNLKQKNMAYALFPAWILTYRFEGKTYVYAVNGQNGRAYGELPLDRKKLGLSSGLIAAAVLALALMGGMWLW
jgi:DNA-directed RNA polymerase subunit RPC12/RpoP